MRDRSRNRGWLALPVPDEVRLAIPYGMVSAPEGWCPSSGCRSSCGTAAVGASFDARSPFPVPVGLPGGVRGVIEERGVWQTGRREAG